jgi:hypothetical protein
VPVGLNYVYAPLAGRNLPIAGEAIAPLLIVNSYGLFATVTTTRPVLIIEGSTDGQEWHPYALPFLPGPVARAPTWNIPYQPRLDWQLWFAGYGGIGQNLWVERIVERLLQGSPQVLALFSGSPFPNAPPKFVRIQIYNYSFAEVDARQWWNRRLEGTYYPPVALENFRRAAP